MLAFDEELKAFTQGPGITNLSGDKRYYFILTLKRYEAEYKRNYPPKRTIR